MRATRLPLVLVALLTFAGPAFAAGASPPDASPTQREQAQTLFSHGRDLFAAKHYAEAGAEFDASYAVVASPNALLYRARCDREQGKLVTAYAELGRTITEAKELAPADPRYAKTAESASAERDALASQIAFLTVSVDHPADTTRVTIGGEAVARPAWNQPFPVSPGNVEIVVQTPGRPEARTAVAVAAGDKKTIAIDATPGPNDVQVADAAPGTAATPPKPAPPTPEEEERSRRRLRTAAMIAGGAGALGFLTLAIAGLESSATNTDLQNECHGPCAPGTGHDSEISRASTERAIADVGLIVGILGAGTGVTLLVMSIPDKKDGTFSLVTGPTWMGVRGTF